MSRMSTPSQVPGRSPMTRNPPTFDAPRRKSSDRYETRWPGRRDSRDDDGFDARDYGRRDWSDRDRDRDRGRDWDRDRDRNNRDHSRSRDRSRDSPHNSPRPRPFPEPSPRSGSPRGSFFAAPPESPKIPTGPRPKGPKASPVSSASAKPLLPPKAQTQRRPSSPAPPAPPQPLLSGPTKSWEPRDRMANMLQGVFRKNKELFELEAEQQALKATLQRREALVKEHADFPSAPELIGRTARSLTARQSEMATRAAGLRRDVVALCKNFVSTMLAEAQKDAEGVVERVTPAKRAMDNDGQVADRAAAYKAATHANRAADKAEKATAAAAAATASSDELRRENAALRDDVAKLTRLVQDLVGQVDAASSARQGLDAKLDRLDARVAAQESAVAAADTRLDDLDRQHAHTAQLRDDVAALQSAVTAKAEEAVTAAAVAAASAPATAPTAAPSTSFALSAPSIAAPPPTPPLVFPGDDFATLRNELGIINERLAPLEDSACKADQATANLTKMLALTRVDVRKLSAVQTELGTAFDAAIRKEADARHDAIAALEQTVGVLQSASVERAAAEAATNATTAPATVPTAQPTGQALATTATTATPSPPLPAPPSPQPPPPVNEVGPVLNRLRDDVGTLQWRVAHAEERYAALELAIKTLDARYNNLTTKELFTAIVGHIEKLYPSTRQLQTEIERLGRRVARIDSWAQNSVAANSKRPLAGDGGGGGGGGSGSSGGSGNINTAAANAGTIAGYVDHGNHGNLVRNGTNGTVAGYGAAAADPGGLAAKRRKTMGGPTTGNGGALGIYPAPGP